MAWEERRDLAEREGALRRIERTRISSERDAAERVLRDAAAITDDAAAITGDAAAITDAAIVPYQWGVIVNVEMVAGSRPTRREFKSEGVGPGSTVAALKKTIATKLGMSYPKFQNMYSCATGNDTHNQQMDNNRLQLKTYHLRNNNMVWVSLQGGLRGGGKRGASNVGGSGGGGSGGGGSGKGGKKTKQETVEELSLGLETSNSLFQIKPLGSRNALVQRLWGVISQLKSDADADNKVMTSKTRALTGRLLLGINTSCSSSNNIDTRLAAIVKALFPNEMYEISETRKQFIEVEAALKEVIRYFMLIEFASDDGVVAWTGEYGFLKTVVDLIAVKGMEEGAAQERAAALPLRDVGMVPN